MTSPPPYIKSESKSPVINTINPSDTIYSSSNYTYDYGKCQESNSFFNDQYDSPRSSINSSLGYIQAHSSIPTSQGDNFIPRFQENYIPRIQSLSIVGNNVGPIQLPPISDFTFQLMPPFSPRESSSTGYTSFATDYSPTLISSPPKLKLSTQESPIKVNESKEPILNQQSIVPVDIAPEYSDHSDGTQIKSSSEDEISSDEEYADGETSNNSDGDYSNKRKADEICRGNASKRMRVESTSLPGPPSPPSSPLAGRIPKVKPIKSTENHRWTDQDDLLIAYLKEVKRYSWRKVCSVIDGRHTWQAIQMRYLRCLKGRYEPFTDDDESRLEQAILKDWRGRWKRISFEMGPSFSEERVIRRCLEKMGYGGLLENVGEIPPSTAVTTSHGTYIIPPNANYLPEPATNLLNELDLGEQHDLIQVYTLPCLRKSE